METKNRFSVKKREITLPQVKQRTGIIIFLESYARVASFSLLSCESFVTLEQRLVEARGSNSVHLYTKTSPPLENWPQSVNL